ncbi:hypothetical protein Scep_020072 [Stephania cephalantha]|uniref:MADS-box domain-containing protein n=1 Tax=Stephania cephalantha TaxID=152367 RepID=A0AAP0NMT5_9MAGN
MDEIATMVSGERRRGARRRGVVESISDPKLRRATFFKRYKNQKKKLYELTTLCDVEAFMICFGPNGELHTWPEDPRELRRKLQWELKRVKKKENYDEEMSTTSKIFGWDSRMDGFGEESMKELLCSLENKIKFLKEKIETMKSSHDDDDENTTTHHMITTATSEMASLVDHQITPNYIFDDDSQFYHQTQPQFPVFEQPVMYPIEHYYNTQFTNNSQFFGFELWDPTMGSSLINNPFSTGTVYEAQPIQAIMLPPLGLPPVPLTNPTTNYNFQNFDVNPYGTWF